MSEPAFANEPTAARALKVPPHSIEAEQSVLGGLMLNNEAWLEVADIVKAEDFYHLEHRILFEAMAALWRVNQPIDATTLVDALSANSQLDRIGGTAYLADLLDSTPGPSNAAAYADIVRKRSTKRQVISACHKIVEAAFAKEGLSSDELVDMAEQEIYAIAERRIAHQGPRPITPMLDPAQDQLKRLHDNRGQLPGLPSGFADLDKKTTGFKDSDFIVIAGRPSMGKTALAMNVVEYAVMGCNTPALVFSLEMAAEQLVMRLLSSLARIDQSKMHTGELEDIDWSRFAAARAGLEGKPLYIDDTPALTPGELRTRTRRMAREAGGVGLIVVDYLQLMRVAGRPENRTNEISEISRSMKALAKEMRCPVIALSQLNREVEKRADKRPMMADLRDSGAIEQDADLILFIYRDEVYNEESPDKGVAEINIGKQRNGVTGRVRLSFLGHLTKFEELAPDRFEQYEEQAPY